jgi:hypothetical protein
MDAPPMSHGQAPESLVDDLAQFIRAGQPVPVRLARELLAHMRALQASETANRQLVEVLIGERSIRTGHSLEDMGHEKPCAFCTMRCNATAGDPARWPTLIGHDEFAHMGCLRKRLALAEEADGGA